MTRIGFITGLEKEAALLRENPAYAKSDIACAGAKSENAYALASNLAEAGCEVLISFGVAGALDPRLKAGDVILPRSVINEAGRVFETDPDHHQKLMSHLSQRLNVSDGSSYGSDNIISEASEKQRLNRSSGAVAVDIESLGIAKAAQKLDCPFLIVRAILDTADQNLPATSLGAIDDDGNIKISRILNGLARNPAELPGLLRLAGNSHKAFASLSRVAALGFGL